jgi:hypothetical protein
MQGRVEVLEITSQALRGNWIGDPHHRRIYVYVPNAYDHQAAQQYPALLMLASHAGTGVSFVGWQPWRENLPDQLDRLIDHGVCPPCIMLMPDTWTTLGGPLHLNSQVLGNYGEFLIKEVIPVARERFHISEIAVMGHSSGGYGALYHAMTAPGVFGACAIHSADAYFEYSVIPEIAKMHQYLTKYGGADNFIADARRTGSKPQEFWELTALFVMAATFSPNVGLSYGVDLPIDMATGALREDIWAQWLAYDLVRLVRRADYIEALRGLRGLYIDCGAYDEYNLQIGARLVSKTLTELGVSHRYEEYPGGHRGASARYDVSVPFLVRALSR